MRRIVPTFALLAALAGAPAFAATVQPYTSAAFAAAQQQGKPILVHVTAPWCPTCAKQRPILAKLESDPKFSTLEVFNVDFDSQKAVLRAMGVQRQSTLIAFHGATEKARSTGETSEDAIRAVLDKAVLHKTGS